MSKVKPKLLSTSVISQLEMEWLFKDVIRKVTLSMAWLCMLTPTLTPTSTPQALKTLTSPSSTLAQSTANSWMMHLSTLSMLESLPMSTLYVLK
jgi:hypothetical protein